MTFVIIPLIIWDWKKCTFNTSGEWTHIPCVSAISYIMIITDSPRMLPYMGMLLNEILFQTPTLDLYNHKIYSKLDPPSLSI